MSAFYPLPERPERPDERLPELRLLPPDLVVPVDLLEDPLDLYVPPLLLVVLVGVDRVVRLVVGVRLVVVLRLVVVDLLRDIVLCLLALVFLRPSADLEFLAVLLPLFIEVPRPLMPLALPRLIELKRLVLYLLPFKA